MEKYFLIQGNRLMFFCLTFLFFLSCNKSQINYYHLINNGQQKVIIEGKLSKKREDGNWSIASSTGLLLAHGRFDDGVKSGIWYYNIERYSVDSISWKVYENKNKQLRINLPKDWKVIPHDDVFFQSTFKTESHNKHNKYLLIGVNNCSDINLNLDQYFDLSMRDMESKSTVLRKKVFKLLNGQKTHYLVKYIIDREGEVLVVYNFIGRFNNKIIDIAYSSLNVKGNDKHLLFFEIISGCYVNEVRILNPLEPITYLEESNFDNG